MEYFTEAIFYKLQRKFIKSKTLQCLAAQTSTDRKLIVPVKTLREKTPGPYRKAVKSTTVT